MKILGIFLYHMHSLLSNKHRHLADDRDLRMGRMPMPLLWHSTYETVKSVLYEQ